MVFDGTDNAFTIDQNAITIKNDPFD